MALGPWTGIYASVITELMESSREPELLLLLAIARRADPLGFCYPGRRELQDIRHVSKETHMKREEWLVRHDYIRVVDTYNPRRRQYEPDWQISPCAMYVRPEMQAYCEAVFFGEQERDEGVEKMLLVNLSSANDSQPDLYQNQNQNQNQREQPKQEPRKHNQMRNRASNKGDAPGSTMRSGSDQPPARGQRQQAQDRKTTAHAGPEEFAALLSPTVPDEHIVAAVQQIASTTEIQAREVVATYDRASVVHWLEKTEIRRARGELKKPGGWFFAMLRKNTPFPERLWPDWAHEQNAAKSGDDDLSELEI